MPKPFPAEFRRDVIAVARKSESSIAQVAKDFGISESCLQRWLKIADREDGLAPPASGDRGGGIKDEAAELRELRRRNKLLEQEYFADATDDGSEAIEWTMPADRFVDAQPLLVLTTASLRTAAEPHPGGDWDVRRFRPNLLLDLADDGWIEDAWCARAALRIGAVELPPQQPCIRCTMVTRPQPDLGADPDIFRTLARHHQGPFGAWTAVAAPGLVSLEEEVGRERR